MTWEDVRRRHEALDEVLRRSRRIPDATLRAAPFPFAEVPGAAATFGTPTALLLALQQRWTTHLAARLDATDGSDAEVIDARRTLGIDLPDLYRVLRAQLPQHGGHRDVVAALDAEDRMLARHTARGTVAAGRALREAADRADFDSAMPRPARCSLLSWLLPGMAGAGPTR